MPDRALRPPPAVDPCRAPTRLVRRSLSAGDAGIIETARMMADIIRQEQSHPVVRAAAEAAVSGSDPAVPISEIGAARDWLVRRIVYRRDPVFTEWLQRPSWVLCQMRAGQQPALDCDDMTMLSLAMLASVGFPPKLRVISSRPDRRYNHVFGLLGLAGDMWVKLDLTRAWRPRSWPVPRITRAFDLAIEETA